MGKVLAIARLAIANAIRSRVVVSLLFLLLCIIVVLPLTIKSDGTVAGHAQILLSYTLGTTYALLAVAMLWAGAVAVAQEIQEKQAHLLVTKPVHHLQIWLGKWLGLLALGAAMLTGCALLIYAMLGWTLSTGRFSSVDPQRIEQHVLAARRTLRPWRAAPKDTDAEHAHGTSQPGQEPQARAPTRYLVGAGHDGMWRFDLPADMPPGHDVAVHFNYRNTHIGGTPSKLRWEAGAPDGPARWHVEETFAANTPHTITIPAEAVQDLDHLLLHCRMTAADGAVVVFDGEDSVQLSVYAGHFETNLLRAVVLLLARLAFLAALGVTAGSLFSSPVAIFVAFSMALLVRISTTLDRAPALAHAHDHGPVHEPGLLDAVAGIVADGVHFVLGPLKNQPVLDMLSRAEFIGWDVVASGVAIKVVVYGGLLALLAVAALRRREIGLPS